MLSWLPENVSTFGGDVDFILKLIYYIVGVWFLAAEFLLFYFLFRYRRKEGVQARYAPGNTLKSLSWVLVPAALVLCFDLLIDHAGAAVWNKVKIDRPAPAQTIGIHGRQFLWEFTQPGRDGQLGTDDDVKGYNHLHVPVGEVIAFELSSEDVIHSFWVPQLRLKQDAVPGRKINGWFEVTKAGEYPIGCAEICGVGHGNMMGTLHADSPEDYQKWLTSQYEEEAPAEEAPAEIEPAK